MLERYFRTKYVEHKKFTRIGGYWNRKGENEMDLIAIDELNNKADVIEIKRNADNISMYALKSKYDSFVIATGELNGFDIQFLGLSMADM